ncbi:MAG: hypothetical protein AB7K24_27675 [Gemmataceae bacterium]
MRQNLNNSLLPSSMKDPAVHANNECLLAELPGAHEDERLLVSLLHDDQGGSRISLRQQSWADGIGWFDQKSLDLDPEQLRQLRAVLGWKQSQAEKPTDDSDRPATLRFPGIAARAVNQ